MVALLALVVSVAGSAIAQTPRSSQIQKDADVRATITGPAKHSGPHLPASKKNMKLVGKLKLTDTEDAITDVAYHRGFAYLGSWHPTCKSSGGPGAGTHIVNVKNPKNPKKVAFAATEDAAYISEGVHVFRANTSSFKGDILLQDRETCPNSAVPGGGFDLYDVTNPRNPQPLALGAGDPDVWTGTPFEGAKNDYHSVMGWQQRGKAYAVGVDNFEFLDVDIFDITDPTNPVLITETGLEDWPQATIEGFGDEAFHHDMWVERIGGKFYMLVSYWDVGYVLLDIDDPANPVFIEDSDISGNDPVFPDFNPPEGNAHQAEWTTDRRFILAADEDFSPYRPIFNITTGDNAGAYQAGEFGWTVPIVTNFEDRKMNGPTVWGGRACPPVEDDPTTPEDESFPGDPPPPNADTIPTDDPNEEPVVVITRGLCFFSEKVEVAQNAGYKAVIIGNSHGGSGNGAAPDAFLCGGQGHNFTVTASAVCIGHRAMHLIFDDEPEYDPETEGGADFPEVGTVGNAVDVEAFFDGWGYMHLLDANTLERIDSYAVRPSKQERHAAAGVFPLSIHELTSDPRRRIKLAYSAYYQAGARVFSFKNSRIRERGHFIPKGGADFWGVEVAPRGKKRPLALFSDRHFGLYITKYTGKQ
jgi:hypothetical protein